MLGRLLATFVEAESSDQLDGRFWICLLFSVIGSEKHFRESLGPERAASLLRALMVGGDRARLIAATEGFVEARTEPTVAFDLATRALSGEFDEFPGVRRETVKGQVLWVLEETYGIRVKRLDTGYRPSNHDSRQQEAIRGQIRLAGMAPLVYVTAGPRCSSLTGLPEEYVVVKHYPSRRGALRVEWVVDLPELAAGGFGPGTPVLPFKSEEPKSPTTGIRSRRRPPGEHRDPGSEG